MWIASVRKKRALCAKFLSAGLPRCITFGAPPRSARLPDLHDSAPAGAPLAASRWAEVAPRPAGQALPLARRHDAVRIAVQRQRGKTMRIPLTILLAAALVAGVTGAASAAPQKPSKHHPKLRLPCARSARPLRLWLTAPPRMPSVPNPTTRSACWTRPGRLTALVGTLQREPRAVVKGRPPGVICPPAPLVPALVHQRSLFDPGHHRAQLCADLLDGVGVVEAAGGLEARQA